MPPRRISPPFRIDVVDGIVIVRDDLVAGGTKRRVIQTMIQPGSENVYASPAQGYAQLALAVSARLQGAQATIFTAKRSQMHPITERAWGLGAKIIMVPHGYMSNVKAKAVAYCEWTGARLMPFGFDTPEFIAKLAALAIGTGLKPEEVWTVAGSGTLSRALQEAWPKARFHAVAIGHKPDVGRAQLHRAPEKFEQDAKILPPFPSCKNYDAKAWRFIRMHASPGALFWNVAGQI